jgi:hypothetical protein
VLAGVLVNGVTYGELELMERRLKYAGFLGLALAVTTVGCDSSASSPEEIERGQTDSGSSGSTSGGINGPAAATTTTSSGGFGAGAGTSGGFNGSGGSNSGAASGSGSGSGSGGNYGIGSATLDGSLAFTPDFQGEFYGLLPDGGADLTNLDCRISNGFDLWQACGSTVTVPATPDGGEALSNEVLDIYVTSADDFPLSTGDADIANSWGADGGTYATIQLTTLVPNGNPSVLIAVTGDVSYQASPSGMSGTFNAVFELSDGGTGTLSGAFGASSCNSLTGY